MVVCAKGVGGTININQKYVRGIDKIFFLNDSGNLKPRDDNQGKHEVPLLALRRQDQL